MLTKTLSKSEVIDHSQKRLRANYPSQWSKETDDLCREELRSLYAEIGPDRMTRTVDEMLKTEVFFQIASLRKHIVPAPAPELTECDTCRKHLNRFIPFLNWETIGQRWSVRVKRCPHNCACTKCGDTGWVVKYGHPGNQPADFEACNCVAGDRFQPRGVTDSKMQAAGS